MNLNPTLKNTKLLFFIKTLTGLLYYACFLIVIYLAFTSMHFLTLCMFIIYIFIGLNDFIS